MLVVGPPRLCVGHGLMDRWIALNSHSLVEGGDDSSRWRWTLTAGFCCRGSFLVMGLPPWAGFGHGFATVGAFGSWFCRR